MRYVSLTTVLTLSILAPYAMVAQEPGTPTIGGYELVREQRVSATESYLTYRAILANAGRHGAGLEATVTPRNSARFTVVSDQNRVRFPSSTARRRSADTFTIRVDRTVPIDLADLEWNFVDPQAPVANAGRNRTVRVGETVVLDASASANPSGSGRLTYHWSVSRLGGSNILLSDEAGIHPAFAIDAPGDYVATLTVTNEAAISSTSHARLSTVNSAPVAHAGFSQTAAPGSMAILNGAKSWDADGDSLTFHWSLVAMPRGSNAVLLSADTVTPHLALDLPGTYLARLMVNDGKTDSIASIVTISTDNTAPVADAGINRVATPESTVELNGSASTDVDGDALTYEWSVIAAPGGSAAILSDRTQVNPKLVIDQPGTYVAQLKVNDGHQDSEPVTVTISTDGTLRPIVSAGRNQGVVPGATVRLGGSSADPQGLPVSLRWALSSRPAGSRAVLSDADGASPVFVADVPGTYTAQLVAHNGMLPSEPSTVTIATADTPPVADAGSGQNVVAGTAVTLDAGGSSDADRHPLQESWAILSRPANSKATLSSSTDVSPSFVPDVPGAYVVQLMVSDGRMNSAPTTAFFTASPLTITTTTLPSAQIGIPYSQALAATGGTPPYFWTVAHGRLPGNFSLDPITGIIGGTAQFTSTSFLTIQVTDSASPAQTATTQLTLAFVQPGLTIVTTSLPAGQKNVPYSQTLVAAGGVQPYTWSLTSGSLPTGWTLNPASGLISGSASIAVANSAVTVRVADSAGSFTTQGLSINVVDGALTITTQSLPNGVVGAAYSAALAASGGIGSLTWQLTAGSLPAGLSLSTGGLISGTPSAPASAVPLSFQVTDSGSPAQTASVNLSLTIGGGLGITTVSLPNGSVGSPYSFVLAAAGGQGTLTWQLTAGVLPAGLSLDASTGTISGTPSSPAGPVPLTFKVTDSASQSAMANLFLTIQGGSLTITTTSLPDGYIGLPYSKQLTATGGTAPYSWSIASGRLPGGFTFDGSTGTIGGSPQFTDPASVTFRVTDSLGQTATANLSVAIYALSFSIVTNALPSGQVNVPYSFALQGIGGVTPYTWTTTSGLPAGMFLNASTGVIGGTPSTTSSSRVTFRLTDSSPVPQSVNASFTLTITGTAFVIVTPSLATGSVGSAYSQVLAATGGTGALTWQLTSGALPAGLTLNAATGLISGTPTASANAVPLSLKATDSSSPAQVATASYTLTIAGNALTITTPSLASGVVGTPYLQTLAAVGGSQPYTWQLTSGTLPAGLSFNTAGQISGTPTASVTAAPLTFKVTDAGSQSASANFGLTIATGSGTGSLTVVTTSLPPALVGVPYSQTLTATGGTLPYTWSLPTGRLPGGFNISPSGTISGTADPANQPDGFLDPLLLGFRVTDSSTPPQSVTVMLTFTITKPALQIVTTILPNGTVGVPYSFTMQASGGGSGIYTWAVQSGVLPSGLSLDPASGVISGTPSATMVRRVIISVTDPAPPPQVFGGSLQTVSASFTLAVQ